MHLENNVTIFSSQNCRVYSREVNRLVIVMICSARFLLNVTVTVIRQKFFNSDLLGINRSNMIVYAFTSTGPRGRS